MRCLACTPLMLFLLIAQVVAAESQQPNPETDLLRKAQSDNRRLVATIRRLEKQVRELTETADEAKREATRLRGELESLRVSLAATTTGGPIEGGEFTYGNFSWDSRDDQLNLLGEIKNSTGKSWKWAHFQVAVYDDSNHLLAVETFGIDNFLAGTTKAFETKLFDVPRTEKYRFKFTFESAAETK